MYQYDIPRSFIARLRVNKSNYQGQLGTVELSTYLDRSYGATYSSWLTLSDYPYAPKQLFWFGALNVANTIDYYEIRTWRAANQRETSHNQRLDWSTNRYIGLYPAKDTPGPFWSLSKRITAPGEYSDVRIISENLRPMAAYNKTQAGDYQSHYLNDEAGETLAFEIEVVDTGIRWP
ncbi:hypothetical protein EXN22_06585 [Pseudomonas tructae]|uniref:Uncharacterized protein n=1 Tax=Pseudomonas tructae TaxID=2518644 RepID=A0A411MFA1_9PSED|nr:hypothetical protein [Pseudomonas tructae]QBF25374.1 hypothetical protein EXN22_06585 [Pseudomonas tructae]